MPRAAVILVVLAAVLAAGVALRLGLAGDLSALSETARAQAVSLRIGRVAAAVIVGAALAVGGVLLQRLLRNPLASPDVLGCTSGATLGVIVAIFIQYRVGAVMGAAPGSLGAISWQGGPALIGAMAALGVVYLLGHRRGMLDPLGVVLIGVVVSIMCGALVMLVQHLMPDVGYSTMRLLIGSLSDDMTSTQLWVIGGVVAAGVGAAIAMGPAMDAAALGEDEAASVGVNWRVLRVTMFVLCGVLTACAVVLAGPVGFVGLVSPHAARLMLGRSSLGRVLVGASAIAGAALVVWADWLVKVVDLGSGRLPLGVVTALVGGPMLVVLVRRGRA
ncbi:MAG: FecCD family ABC transporter permease [Phycisphaerales bacterium]